MQVFINIKCDNAAFSDGGGGTEVAYILRQLSLRIEDMELDDLSAIKLYDSNGNVVGICKTEEDE